MATYTKIPISDLTKIAHQYNIKPISFSPIDGGNSNSNYKIQAEDGAYMLTLCEEKPVQKIEQLIALLNWLAQHQIPTSTLQTTTDGKNVIQYNQKPLFIKKWIKGTVHENLTATMLQEAGIAMAKLHQVPPPSCLPKRDGYTVQLFSDVIGQNIAPVYESWLAQQIDFFRKNVPQDLPKGLIHGDLFFDNILFEEEQVKAIIDFEEASFYYLAFDIGMAIVGLCRTNSMIDKSKMNAFIKGYEQVRVLGDVERKSIPLFIQYAAVSTSCWRFWKYNIQTPMDHLKNHHQKMVQVAKSIVVI